MIFSANKNQKFFYMHDIYHSHSIGFFSHFHPQKKKNDSEPVLEPVSLMIKKSRLTWFGHVERKDDNDWVKRCITWEVEGIRQRGRPKKTC